MELIVCIIKKTLAVTNYLYREIGMSENNIDKYSLIKMAKEVIRIEAEAIRRLENSIGEDFLRAITLITNSSFPNFYGIPEPTLHKDRKHLFSTLN